jgi:hypothetical protein
VVAKVVCGDRGKVFDRGGFIEMSGHYFFHLHNANDVILDKKGVKVQRLDEVGAALVEVLKEMEQEQQLNISERAGWQVRVTDATGNVVMTADLSDLKN